jgi:glycosyltransferase involved in cell wall biosynthesis
MSRPHQVARPAHAPGLPAGEISLHVNALGAVMGGARRHLAAFLSELVAARPSWNVTVWTSEGVDTSSWPATAHVRAVPRYGPIRRLWWESTSLVRSVRRDERAVLVGLTNSGPLRPVGLSLLYQRNAVWFDPHWVARSSMRFRVEAALRRALIQLQMRVATVTVVPSRAMADFLCAWRWTPTPDPVVIPHAVDVTRFRARARPWPPPLATRALTILSVSHGAPHKGQEVLVGLLAGLARRGIEARVWLTADRSDSPDYVDQLVEQARRTGVADRFDLLGRVPDVERLYHEADIMVFPSMTESFGFPVLEAMACGLPVVSSRIAASVELLGDDGWWFEPGDTDAAVDAIAATLSVGSDEMAARLGRARGRAEAFSWSANVAAVIAEIEQRV